MGSGKRTAGHRHPACIDVPSPDRVGANALLHEWGMVRLNGEVGYWLRQR